LKNFFELHPDMNRSPLHSFYEEKKTTFTASLAQATKRINRVSNLRLATALVFLIVLYFAFSNNVLFYALIPLLIAFITLVQKHAALFEIKTHLENLVTINTREVKALSGDLSDFSVGAEFIDPHHPYSHDLDIFGTGSLFQFANRCNTLQGKKKFAGRLTTYFQNKENILEYQQTIQELAGRTDFRQQVEAAGLEIDEQPGDREQLLSWIRQPSFLYPKPFYRYTLIILPIITVALVVGAFFMTGLKAPAIFLAMVQWVILGLNLKRVNTFHDYISRKKNILEKYARLLSFLQHEEFSTPLMKKIVSEAHTADRKVKALASLVSSLNARLNSMTNLVVNSLLLYDLQYVYRLEKWKEENSDNLQRWLDAISETEVLNSWGTFAFNNPGFCYAGIQDTLAIEAKNLGHPLIPAAECVTNDLTIGKGPSILIVTGANMAGKSTFLRTIGINVVLALNGAPVCATTFRCPLIGLRTGMRTADSLKDHQSYFYAELNRLKSIMEELRSDKPLLILLDEILKGTNSTDKQAGSIALVKQLLPHPCLGLIATHDLALGELETEFPQKVKNYCFEPTIENDQLSFDYKLKTGLAQKMNATFLMKKMGIIPA
jgi:hypothetical protein